MIIPDNNQIEIIIELYPETLMLPSKYKIKFKIPPKNAISEMIIPNLTKIFNGLLE